MSKNTKVNKRTQSNKAYIDSLQENYSKLNVIRVDLGYKHNSNISLEDANKDLNRLLNNRRSKPSVFEHNVGYSCKKEYTKDKGCHIHAFFMFDGQKVQKSTYKADQIGKYWDENITKGKGSHHNCHRNKYKNNGIGMIEHSDSEKRENLDKAMEYLSKDEQSIETVSGNKKVRAFIRGTIPKKKGNAGRPRKEKQSQRRHTL